MWFLPAGRLAGLWRHGAAPVSIVVRRRGCTLHDADTGGRRGRRSPVSGGGHSRLRSAGTQESLCVPRPGLLWSVPHCCSTLLWSVEHATWCPGSVEMSVCLGLCLASQAHMLMLCLGPVGVSLHVALTWLVPCRAGPAAAAWLLTPVGSDVVCRCR